MKLFRVVTEVCDDDLKYTHEERLITAPSIRHVIDSLKAALVDEGQEIIKIEKCGDICQSIPYDSDILEGNTDENE